MAGKRLTVFLPALAAVMLLALAGCFKNPTSPLVSGGGPGTAGLPVNSGDHSTTAISALASQATHQGIYLSVVNQNGGALSPTYFRGASFQVNYNGQTVQGGSITVGTASGAGQAISTSLVLDYSGSMSGDIPNLETAATGFVNNMQPADRGEVIKFGTTVVLEQAFTADKNSLRTAITRTTTAGGTTALYDATDQGITDTALESGQRAVVAFTDGGENASVRITSLAGLITQARNHGVPVYTVGLGYADTTTLQSLATQTGGRYYFAPSSAQLAQIYQQIAQIFSNTMIITWPSFTYQSGATVQVMVTYVCGTGTYTSSTSIILP